MRYSMGLLRALVRNTPGSGWHWCPWAKPVYEETCRDACQAPYIVMTHAFVDMAVASKSCSITLYSPVNGNEGWPAQAWATRHRDLER